MKRLITALFSLGLLTTAAFGQPQPTQVAILHSVGGLFTTACSSGGAVLDDHTVLYYYWDSDGDGPDTTDPGPPCLMGYACIPEVPFIAGFQNSRFTRPGGFDGPALEIWGGNPAPALYVRIFFGTNFDSCYTSPVFTPSGDPFAYDIQLPVSDFACGPAPVTRPPGSNLPPEFEWVRDGVTHLIKCVQLFPGGYTSVMVMNAQSVPFNPNRPPVLGFYPGCPEDDCPPVASYRFEPGLWDYLFSTIWAAEFSSSDVGCITVSLLESIPCTTVDTLILERQSNAMLLTWSTTREADVDSFEIWKPIPQGAGVDYHVINLPAAHIPGGTTYSYLDTAAFNHGLYVAYNLVAVDTAAAKFGAFYIESRPQSAEDPHLPAVADQPALHPCYPNPFNSDTRISFDLPRTEHVRLTVLNLLGQTVAVLADGLIPAGTHDQIFSAGGLPSGVYFISLESEAHSQTQKLLLLR